MERHRMRPPRRAGAAPRWQARNGAYPPRVNSASLRWGTAAINKIVLKYWFCAGKPDATGCQPSPLLDITSLVETRRFRGYTDMLNIVSSKARGEASMSAKNGSIKLVAGNSKIGRAHV